MSTQDIRQLTFDRALDFGYTVFAHAHLNGSGRVADFCIYRDGNVGIYYHGGFHKLSRALAEVVKFAIAQNCRITSTAASLGL